MHNRFDNKTSQSRTGMVSCPKPHEKMKIVYYIENGEQHSSLDLDDVEMCIRRGYPYVVAVYVLGSDL
jgi:hypothetical protein